MFADTLSATNDPDGVDLKGFTSATVICSVGEITNIAGSPQPSWTLKLQESDSAASGFFDVDEGDMLLDYGNNDGSVASGVFATIDAADEDDVNYTVGYIGTRRYIRVVATAINAPGNTPIAVTVVKESMQKPQSD
jgi:hypothetical protein